MKPDVNERLGIVLKVKFFGKDVELLFTLTLLAFFFLKVYYIFHLKLLIKKKGLLNMGLTEFVFGAMTGVTGNAVYDSIKHVLSPKNFDRLENFAKSGDRENFSVILETVIESNNDIKRKLEQLEKGDIPNIINQNNVFGDNVARDKIIK